MGNAAAISTPDDGDLWLRASPISFVPSLVKSSDDTDSKNIVGLRIKSGKMNK